MIRKFATVLALGASVLAGSLASISTASAQDGIPSIAGKWAEERSGETFVITRGGFGYEAWISWIGQASITGSNGFKGSHIKIESADRASGPGIVCYYYVSVLNPEPGFRRMTWALRDANTPSCPRAGVYSGVVR